MEIDELLNKIKEVKPKHNTILIGIDGRGGAGKSTLANKLKEGLEKCQIIQMDDFYLPSGKRTRAEDYNFDWKRLEVEVLLPLTSEATSKYQIYDWGKDELGEWQDVQTGGIVIIEGCYSIRFELLKYYDLTIWIEIDRDKAIERGIKRDIDNEKPADIEVKIEQWKNDFQPLEDRYINEHNPKSYADMIIGE